MVAPLVARRWWVSLQTIGLWWCKSPEATGLPRMSKAAASGKERLALPLCGLCHGGDGGSRTGEEVEAPRTPLFDPSCLRSRRFER